MIDDRDDIDDDEECDTFDKLLKHSMLSFN